MISNLYYFSRIHDRYPVCDPRYNAKVMCDKDRRRSQFFLNFPKQVQSFVAKFGNAVATSFIVLMYIIVNLDVASINAEITANPLEMSQSVRSGMFSLVSIIPGLSLLVCVIPILFYNLTGKKKEQITAELEQQRKAKGIVIEK